MMDSDNWRVIPECSSYAISRSGCVKRILDSKTSKAGTFIKPYKSNSGYVTVVLRNAGRAKTFYVHSLVLSAFHGPRPTAKHQAAHINGHREDNSVENLRWASPIENAADKKLHGTDQIGMKHHMRKITDADVLEIRRLRQQGVYCKDVARKFGLHKAYVSLVANGKRWSHVP
jgi:hypothetical protein